MAKVVGQLHLVTDAGIDPQKTVPLVGVAVRAGADVVQVRYPQLGARQLVRIVQAIQREIDSASAQVITNDRVDVALATGADGVHLGQRSLAVDAVRRLVGPDMVIGVSVHSVAEARDAADAGADYLTFGHVYATRSHPGQAGLGTRQLAEIVEAAGLLPVIAIGGITPERVPEVLDAGASGVAVMRGILESSNVEHSTAGFIHAVRNHNHRSKRPRRRNDMKIELNREAADIADGSTIANLVDQKGLPAGSIIVAVNDDVVPRETWGEHVLQLGDSVEIVRAVSGGDHHTMNNDSLTIADQTFSSRLFLGTGKYSDNTRMMAALKTSGTEMVTVAVRYMKLDGDDQDSSILELLREANMRLLPNTAGAYTVRDAVKMARLARAATGTNWIKLEVIGDQASLWPDVAATVEATRILVEEGFVVLPYISPDVVVARQLEEAGAATVMPLASPIGSGQGMQDWASIRRIIDNVTIPVVVDAGIGVPSDASIAMELGADAVLVNTAIAKAAVPETMAHGMRLGVEAGRAAWLAGRMPKHDEAQPSSPTTGVPVASRA